MSTWEPDGQHPKYKHASTHWQCDTKNWRTQTKQQPTMAPAHTQTRIRTHLHASRAQRKIKHALQRTLAQSTKNTAQTHVETHTTKNTHYEHPLDSQSTKSNAKWTTRRNYKNIYRAHTYTRTHTVRGSANEWKSQIQKKLQQPQWHGQLRSLACLFSPTDCWCEDLTPRPHFAASFLPSFLHLFFHHAFFFIAFFFTAFMAFIAFMAFMAFRALPLEDFRSFFPLIFSSSAPSFSNGNLIHPFSAI